MAQEPYDTHIESGGQLSVKELEDAAEQRERDRIHAARRMYEGERSMGAFSDLAAAARESRR